MLGEEDRREDGAEVMSCLPSAVRGQRTRASNTMDILFHCAIVVFSLIISSTSAGEWRTHDYVVREHTLVKPYQGESTVVRREAWLLT